MTRGVVLGTLVVGMLVGVPTAAAVSLPIDSSSITDFAASCKSLDWMDSDACEAMGDLGDLLCFDLEYGKFDIKAAHIKLPGTGSENVELHIPLITTPGYVDPKEADTQIFDTLLIVKAC